MTKDQAVEFAMEALRASGSVIRQEPPYAVWKDRITRNGEHRVGWLVIVPIVVPKGIEPDSIHVDVYEPDGQVYIHYTI